MLTSPDRPQPPCPPPAVLQIGFVGAIGRSCFSDILLRTAPEIETAFRAGSRSRLLADLAAGRLDLAIYPGPAAAGSATALLCEDRLVVALRPSHYLARGAMVDARLLRRRRVLLLSDGDDGELRRLACASVREIDCIVEQPLPALLAALRDTDAVALVPERQAGELGRDVAVKVLAGTDTGFPIHVSWSPAVAAGAAGALIAALAG